MRNRVIGEDVAFITSRSLPWERLCDKIILITGACGFIASYLVDTLLELNEKRQANIQILGLVRNPDQARQRFHYALDTGKLQFIAADLGRDFQVTDPVDVILHAASHATPKLYKNDPVGTILPNVLGTHRLLDLAVQNQVDRFLFISTSGVYGHVRDTDFPMPEHCFGGLDCMDLASCYLESKRMGENLCVAYRQQYGVPILVARPATTYGPGVKLDDGRSFADFVACLVQNRDIEIYSDGTATRNFCYIADAVLGLFTVLLKGEVGEAYNVATDHEISIRDLAHMLVEKVFPEKGLKVLMKADPTKNFLRVHFARTVVDIRKLRALGWDLSFPLEIGFKRTVASHLEA